MALDSTIRAAGEPDAASLQRRFLLILYRGESSQVLELGEGQSLVVGRGPDVDLAVEGTQISRRHARLWREDNRVFVEDLGSTNGTRVNGVTAAGVQRLGPGDEVGLGEATLVVSSLTLAVGPRRILTDGEFEERLEAEVDRAKRYRRSLTLVMLRLPGAAEEIRGHLAALVPTLRRMDLLAGYGPREYALLLPEADGQAGACVVERMRRVLRDVESRTSVGIATLPIDAHSAGMLIEIARERLRGARRPLPASPPASARHPRAIVAESRAMCQTLALARRIAGVETTVLILGETGSGKQVVAEEIHRASARSRGPLVHLNCAAIPPALLESELFGHERGSFTGADTRHVGLVEAAAGGTLLLDEIGELPEAAQPKLLHLLEHQTFTRVGGVRPIRVAVRLLAATNRDLEAEVKAGRFREDLYFRLAAFVVHVPPLRDRPEDLAPLCRQFCAEFAATLGHATPEIAPGAMALIEGYAWPGNVRQLRNALERAVVLAEGARIEKLHLPERVVAGGAEGTAPDGTLAGRLSATEADAIRAALEDCHGNQTAAARRLGITRRSLIYRMHKLGLR